ncbi:HEAT repeat domain-containing protein [Prosthecobacter sp.]|uniref:HEAT repeat domain-containing protein n=1 Tax=Prosthecobacter sp. TaxID=1965333 RepID=UPI0037833AAF
MIKLSQRQQEIITAAVAVIVVMLFWKLVPQRVVLEPQPVKQVAKQSESKKTVEEAPAPAVPPEESPKADSAAFRLISGAIQKAETATESEFQGLVEGLSKLGEGAVDDLGAALRSAKGVPAKTVLSAALVRLGSSEAVNQLVLSLVKITSPQERAAVLSQLDAVQSSLGLETLTSSLSVVSDATVRSGISGVVSRLATDDTVQFLTELYREPPSIPEQPQSVLSALGGISNPSAIGSLSDLVRDAPELPLQYAAVQSLARIGTPEALDGVLGAAFRVGDTNPDYRQAVLTALQNVSNPQAAGWLAQHSATPGLPADIVASLSQAMQGLKQTSAN